MKGLAGDMFLVSLSAVNHYHVQLHFDGITTGGLSQGHSRD